MPFPLPDEKTLAQLYPDELKLKFVEIVHRHGERTPAHDHFHNISPPSMWNNCQLTPFLHALYASQEDDGTSVQHAPEHPARERPPAFRNIVLDPVEHTLDKLQTMTHLKGVNLKGECFQGQLTDQGKATMKEIGQNLRKLYIERLGLFTQQLGHGYHRDVYIRSTDYARTIESVQFLIHGLHPPRTRSEDVADLTVHVKAASDENMYPHQSCSSLNAATKAFRRTAKAAMQDEMQEILQRWKHFITPEDRKLNPLRQVHALFDTFVCMRAHGMPLPKGVTSEDVDHLADITTRQWWNFYDGSEEMASMAIGRVLKDLKAKIVSAVDGKPDAVKMALFSGHDSTIAPLLSAFKVFDRIYPPFASMINIEVFEDTRGQPGWSRLIGRRAPHYVRMLYNGKPLEIPACAADGNHRSGDRTMCTLDAFFKTMDKMVPQNYEERCRTEKFVNSEWKD
ncbi:hypothetical protein HDU85_005161 [Gaertneriomyces sp. JEL0708]|nr:hypothetical protein HDU85_005161 [Gaertneriomyces sp. JEL0708]